MLDYRQIEALARVIEEGGFVRASDVLCLTQSAVSQRVRQLEETCGQVLLTRSSPPQPTPAGYKLLKHYRQVRLLEEGLQDAEDGSPITLSIGVNADSLACWFPGVLDPLLEAGVLFDLRVDDQERTHDLLRNGDVVGCISTAPNAIKGCRATRLGSVIYRLVATPGFAKRWFPDGFTVEAAKRAPTVLYDRNDRIQHDYFESALNVEGAQFVSHFVPSPEQVYRIIAAGHAFGLVPESQARESVADGALIDLCQDHPHTVDLYWHRWNLESEPLQFLSHQLIAIGEAGFKTER